MFLHNFRYTLKTLFRSRMLIFWTFAFPIILGTFFNMAFSDLEKGEKLDIINIAVVDGEDSLNNKIMKQALDNLSDNSSEKRIFSTEYVTEDEAKELLQDSKITGYLILTDGEPKIVVMQNGINETVFKYVIQEIIQTKNMMEDITRSKIEKDILLGNFNIDYDNIYKESLEIIKNDDSGIKDISSNKLSYTMIEFYTLIAMTCLYGGVLGMVAINNILPNMSKQGMRIGVSPVSKLKLILSSVFASYIVQIIGISLLFLYTIFVLNVDYGSNILLVILLALVGCLAGLALGVAIATVFKTNDNIKSGIIISITMVCCFLSGMMGVTMKYVIDKNIPIINKLNPASMITDGFYSLYYYDTFDRFYFNILSLSIFAVIMILISFVSLRRQKYDSI